MSFFERVCKLSRQEFFLSLFALVLSMLAATKAYAFAHESPLTSLACLTLGFMLTGMVLLNLYRKR